MEKTEGGTNYNSGYQAGYRAGRLAKKRPRGPRCKVCGWGKLYAVHLPRYGETEGAWGHEYVPDTPPSTGGDR